MLNFIYVVSFADLNGIIYTCKCKYMRKCLRSNVLTIAFVTKMTLYQSLRNWLIEILYVEKKKKGVGGGNSGIKIPECVLNLLPHVNRIFCSAGSGHCATKFI